MKDLRLLIVLWILAYFVLPGTAVNAGGNTYYVSTAGSDSCGTGTISNPWRTIDFASGIATAGDTVYIRGGTYSESETGGVTIDHSGTFNDWITFAAYPGETPVLDFDGIDMNNRAGILISGKSYIKIEGLEIKNIWPTGDLFDPDNLINGLYGNLYARGIYVTGPSSNIKIYNCYVHDIYMAGIAMGSPGNKIKDVEIYNTEVGYTNFSGSTEPISCWLDGFEIHYVYCHDAQGESGNILRNDPQKKECINLKTSVNGSVHHCYTDGGNVGIYIAGTDGVNSNINIYDNYCTNQDASGIWFGRESGSVSISGCAIYNNILVGNMNGVEINFTGWAPTTSDVTIINNTFFGNKRGIEIRPGTYSSCIARNNILYATVDNSEYINGIYGIEDSSSGGWSIDHNLHYNSGGNFNSANTLGSDSVLEDPDFTFLGTESNHLTIRGQNLPIYDFHLQSGSPAIDGGSSILSPSDDFAGVSRQSGPVDIGAFAYSTGSQPPSLSQFANGTQ